MKERKTLCSFDVLAVLMGLLVILGRALPVRAADRVFIFSVTADRLFFSALTVALLIRRFLRKKAEFPLSRGFLLFAVFRSSCEEWISNSDVMIALENTDGFREYEKAAVEVLLESPKFGLTWDIGHSKAIREADVPFLLAHRDRLIHFHIHDGTEIPPRNHLALGDGEIDLKERLRLAGSRNARCVLETKTIEALERSVLWLRENGFD